MAEDSDLVVPCPENNFHDIIVISDAYNSERINEAVELAKTLGTNGVRRLWF